MEHLETCEEPELELDLAQLFWDLLSQWKAILLVALAFAVVVPSAALIKDSLERQAAVDARQAEQGKSHGLPLDERIENALADLPAEERETVEYLADQMSLLNAQQKYLEHSLLLSGSPTSQRVLYLNYYVQTDGTVEAQALSDAYSAYSKDEALLTQIGQAIDPDAGLSYISELVGTSAIANKAPLDSSATGFMLSVSVVLPDESDADAVQRAAAALVESVHERLSGALGPHTITLVNSNVTNRYNSDVAARRRSVIDAIHNARTSIKSQRRTLNGAQRDALDALTWILAERDPGIDEVMADSERMDTPSPSSVIKYALVGFVGGTFAYCVVYAAVVALRRRPRTKEDLEALTLSRALGDVRYPQPHTGLSRLFHSKAVDERRHGGRGTVEAQVQRAAASVESVCRHAEASSLSVLRLGCTDDVPGQVAQDLVANINARGIEARVIDMAEAVDEEALLGVTAALVVADQSAANDQIWNLSLLCGSYDVRRLGCVFIASW